nr:uncharacterized protein LOC109748473 [Aegilops tauschii subsp. strangulata]
MSLLQLDNPQLQVQQPTMRDVPKTIGTQTQEKKNRKKRACLRKTEDTRLKKLKAKLLVPEDQFIASKCLREFDTAYQDGSLKTKDLLYFAIPPKQHWIVCCINLLYKQSTFVTQVTNFVTLAAHAKAFTKLDFMKFTCFNPSECPQQKTHFDCGIFAMLFMKQWDGKKMAEFCKDTYDHRALITEEILTSQLNTQDPSWVY